MALPTGYKRVEYIGTNGSQYINTGHKVSSEKLTLDFECDLNTYADLSLFGSNDNSDYNIVPYTYGDRVFVHWIGRATNMFPVTYQEHSVVRYVLDNGDVSCTVNGQTSSSTYGGTIINNYDFYIFGKNGNGQSLERGTGYKLYYFKMYDNDVLVCHLVPCLDTNNVPCMYDLVSGNTLYNLGTGSFTYGAIISNLFAAYTDTHGVLPLGYTQLQYIENTTTQFIDTGFTPNGNTSVELRAQREEGEWGTFFGSREGQSSKAYTIQFGSTNLKITSAYGNTAMGGGTTESDGLIHTYYMNKGNLDVDGVREITRATQTFTCPHSAYLFSMYMNAIPTSSRPMKLYYCKIWDDTTLVRHFIPAKRNSDNVVGLYDIVNNVFYTNDGTGDFIAGPVVSELIRTKAAFVKDLLPTGYTRLSYIENPDQNAYINTGIVPDDTTGFKVRMSVRDTATDLYYLGARESNQTDSRFGLGVYQGHAYMALGSYYSDVNNWTITRDTPFVAENNYKNSRVATMNRLNPVSVGTLSGITFTRSIYLFKSNMQTTQNTENCRIYECEITQGTSVVARFIPCFDDNGVACMYDTIRKQTFYSAGSGGFAVSIIPPVVIPSGYTQLKYLDSDGSGQYVDTSYIATQTSNIECDFMITQHNSNLLNYVYGEYTSNKACAIYVSSSTNVYGILYGTADRNTTIPRVFNEKVHSILNSAEFSINGRTESVGGGTFTATNTLYLFKGNGSTRPGMIGRIYYMLIREARGVVSRYLIPCLNSQNQVGFYDVVTEQFYAGTGTFTYEIGVYEDLPKNNSPVEIQLFNFN